MIEATPAYLGLEYQEVFFKAEDGVELNGWFVPAEPAQATLLFCHGNGGNISHRLESIAVFHRLALSVFIFDYRGYGRSRGVTTERGTYLDARAAYEWLVSRGDSERVFIFGRSLGGPIAIDLAAKVETAGLICESSFTSTMDMARDIYRFRPPNWSISNKYDGLSAIGKVDAPKLFIHSKEDEIVPFHHTERLFEAAGGPKELFPIRGGHNDGFLLTGDQYSEGIRAFMEKCLR